MRSVWQRLWAVAVAAAALSSSVFPVCSAERGEATRFGAAVMYPVCLVKQNAVIASAGPVSLGEGSVRVKLVPARTAQGKSFAACLHALGPEQRVYLVLRGIQATEQPAVLFHLYLDVPEGEKPKPGKTDPRYIGTINFYDAIEHDNSGLQASGAGRSTSFNITGLIKRLQERELLSQETTITISSSGSSSPEAKPQISAIELLIQGEPS